MSLKVENNIDFRTHGMFVCSITESKVVSKDETMSYSYYNGNEDVKPGKPIQYDDDEFEDEGHDDFDEDDLVYDAILKVKNCVRRKQSD